MTPKAGFVLTAAALALLATGAWWRRSVPVPAGEGARAAATVETPAAAPVLAKATPASPEANRVLKIAQLLAETRQAPELAASRRREALEGAGRLCADLKARPEAWNDVYDLLCCLESDDLAVKVAGLLQGAVDASLERRLTGALRSESNAQARRVAVTLLEGRRSSDSFAAIQGAVDDVDPQIRLAALEGLAARRSQDRGTVDALLARRVQVEPDPNLRAAIRSLLGEAPPASAPRSASSRGLSLRLKPASK